MTAVCTKARHPRPQKSSDPLTAVSPIVAGVERPVTTAQLAAHLQVTTRTIANYREQRIIPFWRLNARRILYRLCDVERVLSLNNQ
jgi:hypothetical protein